jgi:tryptophan synthase alpha chain
MSRYAALFSELKTKQEAAYIPFVLLGDPNPKDSLAVIKTLVDAGADALELGIPFSDPLADGPTIQGAALRALAHKTTPEVCFDLISHIRLAYPNLPIGLLVYANLIYRPGLDAFYARCLSAGVDSVLIADVPMEESDSFRNSAEQHGIDQIYICPPNANESLIEGIAQKGKGYTYLLSRAGVTGTQDEAHMPLDHILAQLKLADAPPAVLGFGISRPEQVRAACAAGVAGVISGSAVVNLIEKNLDHPQQMLAELALFTQNMKAATKS